jgi:hypothetical protein
MIKDKHWFFRALLNIAQPNEYFDGVAVPGLRRQLLIDLTPPALDGQLAVEKWIRSMAWFGLYDERQHASSNHKAPLPIPVQLGVLAASPDTTHPLVAYLQLGGAILIEGDDQVITALEASIVFKGVASVGGRFGY